MNIKTITYFLIEDVKENYKITKVFNKFRLTCFTLYVEKNATSNTKTPKTLAKLTMDTTKAKKRGWNIKTDVGNVNLYLTKGKQWVTNEKNVVFLVVFQLTKDFSSKGLSNKKKVNLFRGQASLIRFVLCILLFVWKLQNRNII